MSDAHATSPTPPRKRPGLPPVPREGEDGLFTQSWFPICLSSDIQPGASKGFDFLDGRVVVFRTSNNKVQVLSAYCPHMGTDLSLACVINDTLRCPFHHWHYDSGGVCVKTMVGDPAPPNARLFNFPTAEKYGLVWAFNGETPLWQLPDFPFPEEELAFKTIELPGLSGVDPWVQCCNTPDMQHIKALHNVKFSEDDPHERVRWTPYSMMYDFDGIHVNGEKIFNTVGVFGTSLYYQTTLIDGRWFGFLTPMGLPKPGHAKNFMVVAAKKSDGTSEEVQQWLDFVLEFEKRVVNEDLPIMESIHFHPGTLTRSDMTFARYIEFLRRYPRAHPSAEFIK